MSKPASDFPYEQEFQALFANVPKMSAQDLESLRDAAKKLELDADYQADYWQGRFAAAIQGAMHTRNVSASWLSRMWGKTRQYVSRLLNDDKRVNVTIKTMTKLAALLRHRIEIQLIDTESPRQIVGTMPGRDLAHWPDAQQPAVRTSHNLHDFYAFTNYHQAAELCSLEGAVSD